jgi:hypothetical protein
MGWHDAVPDSRAALVAGDEAGVDEDLDAGDYVNPFIDLAAAVLDELTVSDSRPSVPFGGPATGCVSRQTNSPRP